jgi:hypothetical protein
MSMGLGELWTLFSLVISEATSAELPVQCGAAGWLQRGALSVYKCGVFLEY